MGIGRNLEAFVPLRIEAFVSSLSKKAGGKLAVLARLSKFISFKQMNPYEKIC